MNLSKEAAKYFIDHKQYLEKNDLAGFYKDMRRLADAKVKEIGQCLETSGVQFEQFLNEIPDCFRYAPKSWLKGKTLVVPSNITYLGESAFFQCENFEILDARGAEEVRGFVVDYTPCKKVIFGPNLSIISEIAIAGAKDLEIVKIPASLDNSIKEDIKKSIHYCQSPYNVVIKEY